MVMCPGAFAEWTGIGEWLEDSVQEVTKDFVIIVFCILEIRVGGDEISRIMTLVFPVIYI